VGCRRSLKPRQTPTAKLYGIEPFDPVTVSVEILALGAIAIAGSFVPALRGARIQPLKVLREEQPASAANVRSAETNRRGEA
jgi:hypothetical protein